MPIVVTLVHGTWARNAKWTQEGSPLRTKLAEAFGDRVVFRVFPWSGANSFSARCAGAAALRQFLQDGVESAPGSKQIIIAHSHGGNVALDALRDFEGAGHVAAVICLATPFVSTRARDFGEYTHAVVDLAKRMTAVIVGALIGMAITTGLNASDAGYWGPIALVIMLLASFGTWLTLSKMGKLWQQRAEAWAKDVAVSVPAPPTRLFIVCAAADEVSEGLAAFHFPLTLVFRGWKVLAWLALLPLSLAAAFDEWLRHRLYRRLLTAIGLGLVALLWTSSVRSPRNYRAKGDCHD